MQLNNDGKSLGEAEFNNLCSHYKDTYEIHLASIKQRDILFYALLIILAFFSLQVTSTALVNGALTQIINNKVGVIVDKSSNLFGALLWLLLFGASSKYFQIVLQIERQYDYIHHLEEVLSGRYGGTRVFTREGKSYLETYPLFSKWIWFLYTAAFPAIILLSILLRIKGEINRIDVLGFELIPSFVCYFLVVISTILYLWKLHGAFLLKIVNSCIYQIKRSLETLTRQGGHWRNW
ncbi:MAG: hypothetical protein ACOYLR_09710 [Chlorobium sp.]